MNWKSGSLEQEFNNFNQEGITPIIVLSSNEVELNNIDSIITQLKDMNTLFENKKTFFHQNRNMNGDIKAILMGLFDEFEFKVGEPIIKTSHWYEPDEFMFMFLVKQGLKALPFEIVEGSEIFSPTNEGECIVSFPSQNLKIKLVIENEFSVYRGDKDVEHMYFFSPVVDSETTDTNATTDENVGREVKMIEAFSLMDKGYIVYHNNWYFKKNDEGNLCESHDKDVADSWSETSEFEFGTLSSIPWTVVGRQ